MDAWCASGSEGRDAWRGSFTWDFAKPIVQNVKSLIKSAALIGSAHAKHAKPFSTAGLPCACLASARHHHRHRPRPSREDCRVVLLHVMAADNSD